MRTQRTGAHYVIHVLPVMDSDLTAEDRIKNIVSELIDTHELSKWYFISTDYYLIKGLFVTNSTKERECDRSYDERTHLKIA